MNETINRRLAFGGTCIGEHVPVSTIVAAWHWCRLGTVALQKTDKPQHVMMCEGCGKQFTGRKRRWCTKECRSPAPIMGNRACTICKTMFRAGRKRKTCGNPECRREHKRNMDGARQVDHPKASKPRRDRMRIARLNGEYVDRLAIFERDGYLCGLCGEATAKGQAVSHRGASPIR